MHFWLRSLANIKEENKQASVYVGRFHSHLLVYVYIYILYFPRFSARSTSKLANKNIRRTLFQRSIDPLQFTITWYKNRHAGEQTAHWDIQNKRILSKVALFWLSQWAVCSPAWRFLYHVIVNCKEPIE